MMGVIRQESVDIAEQFKDERRTEILDNKVDIDDIDLIDDVNNDDMD